MVLGSVAHEPNGANVISERQFASGFSSFWGELLPLLTPACMTLFNESHVLDVGAGVSVDSKLGLNISGLPLDLLAEAAFKLAQLSIESGTSGVELIKEAGQLERAWGWAATRIMAHRHLDIQCAPTAGSLEHSFLLAAIENYDEFHQFVRGRGHIFYAPRIPGCGFLSASEADVAAGDTLYEVKTVGRGFGSKDIKQLVTYLALDHCSGGERWRRGGLFNPRKMKIATFDPVTFLAYVSGGESATTVYREIEMFLLSRDIQIEKVF